jgi:hypothetical protein
MVAAAVTRPCALCGRPHTKRGRYCGSYCSPRVHALLASVEKAPATYEMIAERGPSMPRLHGSKDDDVEGYKLDAAHVSALLGPLVEAGRIRKAQVGVSGPVVLWVRPEHEAAAQALAHEAAQARGAAIGADCRKQPRRKKEKP